MSQQDDILRPTPSTPMQAGTWSVRKKIHLVLWVLGTLGAAVFIVLSVASRSSAGTWFALACAPFFLVSAVIAEWKWKKKILLIFSVLAWTGGALTLQAGHGTAGLFFAVGAVLMILARRYDSSAKKQDHHKAPDA